MRGLKGCFSKGTEGYWTEGLFMRGLKGCLRVIEGDRILTLPIPRRSDRKCS